MSAMSWALSPPSSPSLMLLIFWIEVTQGIGGIGVFYFSDQHTGVFGLHGYEYLDKGNNPVKKPSSELLFYLVVSLAHEYAAFFKLDVDNRHTVDEEDKVAPAVVKYF